MESLAAQKHSWLSWFVRGVLFLGFIILAARLIELQLIKGNYFRGLAENNRIRRVPITAARGEIKDRKGEVIVGNKEIKKAVYFDPASGFVKTEDVSKSSDIITESLREYNVGTLTSHLAGYLGEVNNEELGKVDPDCLLKGPRTLGLLDRP